MIGNGAYKNVHALPNPPRDSKLVATVLHDLGFQTVMSTSDLTRDKFFQTLQAFAEEAEKADWAMVYYAGHGFEIGGVNYLVPVDAKLSADKDAETEAVALEQVIAAVGRPEKCVSSSWTRAATIRSRRPCSARCRSNWSTRAFPT